jgi:hypothetical protein
VLILGTCAISCSAQDINLTTQANGQTAADQTLVSASATVLEFAQLYNCANDGAHALTYATSSHTFACTAISPGGPSYSVQYNNGGVLGGASFNGLGYFSTSAAPTAATAAEIGSALNNGSTTTFSVTDFTQTIGNGFYYAAENQTTPTSHDGILNSLQAMSGDNTVIAEPTYSTAENINYDTLPSTGHVIDYRHDSTSEMFLNSSFELFQSTDFAGREETSIYNATPSFGTAANTAYSTLYLNTTINGAGYDLGNNGTSAIGWSTGTALSSISTVDRRGISSSFGGLLTKNSIGDVQGLALSTTAYGGTVAASDQGINSIEDQVFQKTSYTEGAVSVGASTGSTQITISSSGARGGIFDDGGILIDQAQGGAVTATLLTTSAFDTTLNSAYYTISMPAGETITPSTAYGTLVPSSCTGNGYGEYQVYTSTTCNIATPTASGHFVVSGIPSANLHMILSGPFYEEVQVTAVTIVSSSLAKVTFLTRYAWNQASNPAIAMQGGLITVGSTSQSLGGQALVAAGTIGTWPLAWRIVGALNIAGEPTEETLYYANCRNGECNGVNSSYILPINTSVAFYPSAEETIPQGLIAKNDVANLATNSIPFTISSFTGSISGTTLTVSSVAMSNTLYLGQMVFGTGVTSGTTIVSQVSGTTGGIGTYTVSASSSAVSAESMTANDVVIATPTTEYGEADIHVNTSRNTPSIETFSEIDQSAIYVDDVGINAPLGTVFGSTNNATVSNPAFSFAFAHGLYQQYFALSAGPAPAGSIIRVADNLPSTASYTGTISGTTLTVSSMTSGTIVSNQAVTDNAMPTTNILPNTIILSQISGPTGGNGTYMVNLSQTVASELMTGKPGQYNIYTGPGGSIGVNPTAGYISIAATAITLPPIVAPGPGVGSMTFTSPLSIFSGQLSAPTGTFTALKTATNCSSATSPAACGSASSGSFVIAVSSTSVLVDTTAVTAGSQILIQPDESALPDHLYQRDC